MATSGTKLSRLGIAGALILLIASLTITATALLKSSRPGKTFKYTVSLSSIPDGVSARKVGETPLFLVRSGSSMTAFLTDVQHLPGEKRLWWCPHEQRFASPTHGELFNIRGEKLAGPAARGLARVQVTITGDLVRLELSQIQGFVQPSAGATEIIPAGKWDSGDSSFCRDPLRSDRL